MASVDDAIAAIRAGDPVVLPFDTVYGLASDPSEEPVRKLYALKGRAAQQPTALVAASAEALLDLIPEFDPHLLLRGPFTLIVPNPSVRFAWLTGDNPEAIGVRIPDLPSPTAEVLAAVGVVVATSANHPGGRDPSTFDEVPEGIRAGAAAAIDGGPVPGKPSTVVDLTQPEPRIVREGAVSAEDALRRLRAAVRSRSG